MLLLGCLNSRRFARMRKIQENANIETPLAITFDSLQLLNILG